MLKVKQDKSKLGKYETAFTLETVSYLIVLCLTRNGENSIT